MTLTSHALNQHVTVYMLTLFAAWTTKATRSCSV